VAVNSTPPATTSAGTRRHRGPGSRPSGNSSSAIGRHSASAHGQAPLVSVASTRQAGHPGQPPAAAQASTVVPVAVAPYRQPPTSSHHPTGFSGRCRATGQPAPASASPSTVLVTTNSSSSRAQVNPDSAPATTVVAASARASTSSPVASRARLGRAGRVPVTGPSSRPASPGG
jgi:hypothetical protein